MSDWERGHVLTRRRLLQSGGAAAAVALIDLHPVTAALASNTNAASSAPAYLRRSSYTSLAGEGFTVSADGAQQTLQLLSVSDLERPGLQGADDAFILQFAGPGTETIEQGTYVLSHPTLGSFELFSTPVDQLRSTQTYAVVIDRSIAIKGSEAPASPTPATNSSTSPVSATAPSAHKPPPVARESVFRRIHVARFAHGVRVELSFAANSHVEHIHAWLTRKGRPVGVASHRVSGEVTKFEVPSSHHLPDGDYEIKLIATARHGVKSGMSREIKLT